MPVYNIASRHPLSYAVRKKAADAITDVHCAMTGAPAEFVNVIFMEGHPIQHGKLLGVICNVRKGGNRNNELTDELRRNVQRALADAIGIHQDEIVTGLIGFPASWAMEGGEILPEPGEEAGWHRP
jgi:phenylpyruvate tautomerase PptA (4-oxalocrotonate tautomerase family)